MLPMPAMPAMPAECAEAGEPGDRRRRLGVVVVVGRAHRRAEGGGERLEHRAQRDEVEVDPALAGRPSAQWVANVAVSPVSPTTRVCAACASSSNCARSRGRDGGSGLPSSATHSAVWRAISQLTGPVDCSIRITWLRSICEKSNVAGSNPPPGARRRTEKAGKPGGRRRAVRSSSAPRGLQVEDGRPRGQCMDVHAVAVTGASGLVGRHLLPLLAAHPDVERVARRSTCASPSARPPQARVPPRRHRRHRAQAAARGHRRGRAPRRRRRPDPRRGAHGAGQRRGHAPRARRRGRGRRARRIVRISSATVYGAWPNNPVPLTEDAAAAPEPALLAGGAGRGGGAPARRVAGRAPRRDRHHPALGAGRRARAPNASRPASCSGARRCASGARRCRCRSCTSTTSPSALALAATQRSPGRLQRRGRRLARRRRRARRCSPSSAVPALPAGGARARAAAHVGARARRRPARASCRTSSTRG